VRPSGQATPATGKANADFDAAAAALRSENESGGEPGDDALVTSNCRTGFSGVAKKSQMSKSFTATTPKVAADRSRRDFMVANPNADFDAAALLRHDEAKEMPGDDDLERSDKSSTGAH
jgi:hypothetical protein